jgi:glyoxylase-like metal-dependent hydrolase (beta-lactamase superfamily II)
MIGDPQIYAIRYGSVELARSACFLGWPEDGVCQQLDFYFWAIVTGNGAILVDTGFNAEVAAKRDRHATLPPADALAILGIDPILVEQVIMTHLHFDHAGNSAMFPNATFHLQASEMAYATGRAMADEAQRQHYAVEDVACFVELVHAGRVIFHDGDGEIAPGITVHRLTGHTPGVQCVRVMTTDGPVVLASDALHFYASLRDGLPFPVATDPAAKLQGYQTLRGLAGDNGCIVAGHDPEVRRLFPGRGGHPDIVHINGGPAFPLSQALPDKLIIPEDIRNADT